MSSSPQSPTSIYQCRKKSKNHLANTHIQFPNNCFRNLKNCSNAPPQPSISLLKSWLHCQFINRNNFRKYPSCNCSSCQIHVTDFTGCQKMGEELYGCERAEKVLEHFNIPKFWTYFCYQFLLGHGV